MPRLPPATIVPLLDIVTEPGECCEDPLTDPEELELEGDEFGERLLLREDNCVGDLRLLTPVIKS